MKKLFCLAFLLSLHAGTAEDHDRGAPATKAASDAKPDSRPVAPAALPPPPPALETGHEKDAYARLQSVCDTAFKPDEKDEVKLSVRNICNLFNRHPQTAEGGLPDGKYLGLCFVRGAGGRIEPEMDWPKIKPDELLGEWKQQRPSSAVVSRGLVPEKVLPSGLLEGKRPQLFTEKNNGEETKRTLEYAAAAKAFQFGTEGTHAPGARFRFLTHTETRVRHGKAPDGTTILMTVKSYYHKGYKLGPDGKWGADSYNIESQVCLYNPES